MNAIKKEVQFLRSEVPHFADIYAESLATFADSEPFALIQALTQWVHHHGNTAVQQFDAFISAAEQEILSLASKMEKQTHENKKLQLIVEQTEHDKDTLASELASKRQMATKYASESDAMEANKRSMMLNQ